MPLLFIGSGLILVLTGVKGNPSALWSALQADFTGPGNFVYWSVSILALGALGYVPPLKNTSRLFIVLVLIVLLLDNGGFFTQFQKFINSNSSASSSTPATTAVGG